MTKSDKLPADKLLSQQRVLEWVPDGCPDMIHIAVSFAGRLLSDLGATVIRVTPERDPLLSIPSAEAESVGSSSVLATFLNRSKHQVQTQERSSNMPGVDLAILGSPVCLEDTGVQDISSVLAETGLGDRPISELGVQALVGLTDLFGEPEQQPLAMGGHQTAYAMGYAVFCAAMAAVAKLSIQGETDRARVTAVDALAWINWKGIAAGALGFPVVRGGRGAEAPVLKCADGYFAFLHLPNNWPDVCAEVGDPRLRDEQFASAGLRARNAAALNKILAEWAAGCKSAYLYEFCQRCAIPGGPVMSADDLLQEPLYLYRNYFADASHNGADGECSIRVPGLPMTVEGSAAAIDAAAAGAERVDWGSPSTKALPLAGMLVLDLGIFTAGSVTSTLLADLGARVVKVESETYSDPFRIWPGIKGDSPLFTFNNRNKLAVNLDLKTEAGRAAFLKLVAEADVVVENFRRGVLKRLGIDYPVLQKANPRIVLASISGQGAEGPGAGHVSFGSTLEAIGGVAALTGYRDGPCYISGRNLNYPDQIVCLYGAGAAIAAILKARQAGCGMHIDVSQREVTSLAVGERIAAASYLGDAGLAGGFPGNSDPNMELQDIFAVQDGWLWISMSDSGSREVLVEDLRCEPGQLEAALAAWLSGQNVTDAEAHLLGLGIAAGRANTGSQAAEEPAIKAGIAFAETAAGAMVKGFPFQFEKTPMVIYEESPRMGEHTERILDLL